MNAHTRTFEALAATINAGRDAAPLAASRAGSRPELTEALARVKEGKAAASEMLERLGGFITQQTSKLRSSHKMSEDALNDFRQAACLALLAVISTDRVEGERPVWNRVAPLHPLLMSTILDSIQDSLAARNPATTTRFGLNAAASIRKAEDEMRLAGRHVSSEAILDFMTETNATLYVTTAAGVASHRTSGSDLALDAFEGEGDVLPDAVARYLSREADRDDALDLAAAIRKLDPRLTKILNARVFEDMSNTETAERFKISAGQASKLYSAGIERLKEILV